MFASCEWCGAELDHSRSRFSSKLDISHMICLSCASGKMMEIPIKLRNFLNDLSMPVVLVDKEGIVQVANVHTSQMLQKTLASIEGNAGGDVFECAYSKLPERCGNTIHCSGCTIRNAVMDTHATGKPLMRIPAILTQGTVAAPQEHCFHVSTEKLSEYVILKVEANNCHYHHT